jgi:hypothetical protein
MNHINMQHISLEDLLYFQGNYNDFKLLSERFDDIGAFMMDQ